MIKKPSELNELVGYMNTKLAQPVTITRLLHALFLYDNQKAEAGESTIGIKWPFVNSRLQLIKVKSQFDKADLSLSKLTQKGDFDAALLTSDDMATMDKVVSQVMSFDNDKQLQEHIAQGVTPHPSLVGQVAEPRKNDVHLRAAVRP